MTPLMNDLMRQASQLTRAGQLHEATQAIQQALAGRAQPQAAEPPDGLVLDGCVFEATQDDGCFTAGAHSHAGLARDYKLFTPTGYAGKALPLLVMLHGCTQNPDDFAAGTAMNAHAQQRGFAVLYPAQAQSANPSRCWNWFKHNHQQRGAGEPALIADLVQQLVRGHRLDAQRVFVAGLSAGGAMAAILGAAYPELFAGVGVHSGLPVGCASGVPEALAVMRSGSSARSAATLSQSRGQVRTIVFHGDRDGTVHPRNGEQVIASALAQETSAHTPVVQSTGKSAQGQAYTRMVYTGANGKSAAEHWVLHGAGHAWSGGQAAGSYTDTQGADASAEILRFFGL